MGNHVTIPAISESFFSTDFAKARCEATGQDFQARNEPQKIRRLVNFG